MSVDVKLCEDKLCVDNLGWDGRRREEEEEADGMQNQKQEPHTKMWGITHGSVSKPVPLVNIKIAGKWMFIPLKIVLCNKY